MKSIEDEIIDSVKNKRVVVYNKDFDMRYLTERIKGAMLSVECCMRGYAEFHKELNVQYGTFKWQSLVAAAGHIGYKWSHQKHQALSDALASRAVWKFLEEQQDCPKER